MDPSFKSLPFISTDYRAEVHENIKQLAIALVRSSKVASSDKSSDQAVGTGTHSGASGSGPACKKHKHEETWSVIWDQCSTKKIKVGVAMIHLQLI